MIKNKKGLSAIVITVILVALVLVAVAIVWAVVRDLIGGGVEDIELSAKCLNIDIEATAVDCTIPASCSITLTRTGTNSDEIAGVKLVFGNDTVVSSVITEEGNIEALAGKTITGLSSEIANPNEVGVTVYFENSLGEEDICQKTITTNF